MFETPIVQPPLSKLELGLRTEPKTQHEDGLRNRLPNASLDDTAADNSMRRLQGKEKVDE